jgi:DNA-binding winged helix-turn-helix (wHTH) protein
LWYAFDDYTLDAERYELRCAGKAVPLRPKPFEVLAYLLEHRDRIVPKDELLVHLWAGRFVGDATLNSCIKEVRRAIGDSAAVPHLLRTVRGRGYRFVAPVQEHSHAQGSRRGNSPPIASATAVAPPQDDRITASVQALPEAMADVGRAAAVDTVDTAGFLGRGSATATLEWKLVTVMCCALAEAAAGSGLPASEARFQQMQAIHALARQAVQRYGGTLQPVVGEHIIAVFGAPLAQEDHAQRAALAALELLRRGRRVWRG